MAKLNQAIPGLTALANLGMRVGSAIGLLDAIGIAGKAPLPSYSRLTFKQRFRKLKQTRYTNKVVFFPGCYVNYNDPELGLDLVEVLQKNKIEVLIDEDFVCCGSPLVAGGYLDEARQNADKNRAAIKRWGKDGYPVITCCPSCALMLTHEYRELFGEKDDVANQVYDVMEYLAMRLDSGAPMPEFHPLNGRYIYHAPCHLKSRGIGTPALELLSRAPGIEVLQSDAGCCGISGSYGFKADTYEIAMAVGKELFETIRAANADAAISDCGTCRLQIAHGAGIKTLHPITILRRSLD